MAKLDGSPDSIRAVARWLRTLAAEIDNIALDVRRLGERSLESWWDPAGVSFSINLGNGSTALGELSSSVTDLARSLDETADDLRTAQDKMNEAWFTAVQMDFEIKDNWVFEPPHPNDAVEMGIPAYDPASSRDLYIQRVSVYREMEASIDAASQIVLDRLGVLGHKYKFNWNKLYFSGSDFASGETVVLAKWFEKRLLEEGADHRTWGTYWVEQSKAAGPVPVLEEQFRRNASKEADGLLQSTYTKQNWGFAARVVKRYGGPFIAIAGTVYDIKTGEPPDKAILTGAIGLGVGLAFACIPIVGWAAAAGVAVAAALAGLAATELVGWLYDLANQKTARELLFES